MRRIAYHQIPLLGCWDILEIVGMINRYPLGQAVLCDSAAACMHRFWIDVGKTQAVAKSIAEQSKADESWPRAPLKHAALARHSEVMKQRQVFHTRCASAAVQVIAVVDGNIAVAGTPPWLQAPQSRLQHAAFETFEKACQ